MGVRRLGAPAAGVVSVAILAVAKAAKDVRPSSRVTRIRVAQVVGERPLATSDAAPAPSAEPAPIEPPPPPLPPPLPLPDAGEAPPAAKRPPPAGRNHSAPSSEASSAFWFEGSGLAAHPEPEAIADRRPGSSVRYRAVPERPPVLVAPEPVRERPATSRAWGWSEPWSFEVPATPTSSEIRRGTAGDRSRGASRRLRRGRGRLRPLVAVAALALAVGVWMVAPRSPSARAQSSGTADARFTPHPSAFALRTIPIAYLRDYWKAARQYGLNWAKLAAVGQLESNHGRSQAAGVSQGTNASGAAGPAQFLGSTWARYGVDADGRDAISPYDPADAITAMAAYLKASGAPQHWRAALFAYNHSIDYVDAVIALSRLYLVPRSGRG